MNNSTTNQDLIDVTVSTFFLKMDKLYHKYKQLQNLYYSMYIETFSDSSFDDTAHTFIKLYNDFKGVCRLLTRIKNLFEYHHRVKVNSNLQESMLGSEELKTLLHFKDMKKFMDENNLYPIIDSNF